MEDELLTLEWSKNDIENLLNSVDSIIIVSKNGKELVNANQKFFDFFNEFKTLELFNKDHNCICDFFEPCDEEGFIYKKKVLDGMSWINFVLNSVNKIFKVKIIRDTKTFIFDLKITLLSYNEYDIDVYYVITMNDITILQEYQVSLELKVKEEVKKRIEKENFLIQQNKLASMGKMIENIAHQWRQPLNAINIRMVQLEVDARETSLDSNYIKIFLKGTNELVQYMSKTIDDFRNFFVESKDKTTLHIYELINDAIKIIGISLKKHKIKLTINGDEKLELYGLQNELKQVILNILSNAKDAIVQSGRTTGQIDIKYEKVKNDIVFKITDNGGGISNEIINNIFEPYFTTKNHSCSTGLGLYMSKMIIEKNMQGKLEVTNINGGTTIKITIKQKDY